MTRQRTPKPPVPGTGLAYTTATYAASAGLDPATAQAALDDAHVVYQEIEAQPWIDHQSLTQWAVSTWSAGPLDARERLASALGLLQRMGCVVSFGK